MSYAKIAITAALAIGGGGLAIGGYKFLGPTVDPVHISNITPVKPLDPYTKVTVHFGTDRKVVLGKVLTEQFGPLRSEEIVTYGSCTVSIPEIHREGVVEALRW